MSDSEKTSVPRMILQAVEDFATIVKGEVEIAKKSLTTSVKKLGLGIGFIITAFLLLNVSLLFLLIALAYGLKLNRTKDFRFARLILVNLYNRELV